MTFLLVITITLKTGEKEVLLTNLPQNIMSKDDLEYLYSKRWGIETNYNTLKNRFYIEQYSSKKRQGIEQDVYTKFLILNIYNYIKLLFNWIIMIDKYLKGVYDEYQVDQTNLIRNVKDNLPFVLLSPFEVIREIKCKLFYNSCMRSPRKVTEHETTDRKNNCILRTPISYSRT